MCWHFFDLNEKMIVKKENISSFLLAKIYDINFLSPAFSKGMLKKART